VTQIGTGAAGFMAIRVLIDHGVDPSHIIFVTFLVARSGGVAHLRRTFPDVKIVTGAVDDGLREVWLENAERRVTFLDEDGFDNAQQHKAWVVEPGMGQIGKSPLSTDNSSSPALSDFFNTGDRYYLD
jgi:uridine kinase